MKSCPASHPRAALGATAWSSTHGGTRASIGGSCTSGTASPRALSRWLSMRTAISITSPWRMEHGPERR
ncbi:unnamed protein product [Symbiodinium natans]|uniref:Uncharacterized protein n=1 Tax=Symbiodinium natans TaxID=878477 RepID=A0A812NZK8_9DINO|nr:unnamed protein product [Symbiodinium natans]